MKLDREMDAVEERSTWALALRAWDQVPLESCRRQCANARHWTRSAIWMRPRQGCGGP